MASSKTTLTLRLEGLPESMAAIRFEMARLLRREAEGEPEFVARKLRDCADKFEAGVR